MPFYEYECSACGHTLEVLQKISDAPLTECPNCQQKTLTKLISRAGFKLTGTGWYETDFKNSGKKGAGNAGSGKSATGAASGQNAGQSGSRGDGQSDNSAGKSGGQSSTSKDTGASQSAGTSAPSGSGHAGSGGTKPAVG